MTQFDLKVKSYSQLKLYLRLLKANQHVDKASAQILLDRALIVKDNKLEFSRDTKAKLAVIIEIQNRIYSINYYK